MTVVLETERLTLRPLTVTDLGEFMAMHAAPEVIATMGTYGETGALDRLERNELEWRERGYGLMAMLDRNTGSFVGRSGLKYWPEFEETEVGWVVQPALWGQGFATEAARACLDWGFGNLDVPYITAMILPNNTRSLRVAERLGMAPVRSDKLFDLPVVVHAIDREAWPGATPSRDPLGRS
jgi:RimJ/RimL family protein N-acetyltransferase